MKRVSGLVLVAILSLALTSPTVASSGSCTISPSPVPFMTDFTISAQVQPNKAYDIRIDQDDHFGHHDDAIAIFADGTGFWTYTYNLWLDPRDNLTVGDFNVHIKPSSNVPKAQRGSGGAACTGMVI